MKQARAADHWRRLKERELKAHLREFSGSGVPNMPAKSVPAGGAITIITGLNGVGKSSLLHSACLLLRRDGNNSELSTLKECDGTLKAQLVENGAILELVTTIQGGKVAFTPAQLATQMTWIDPAFEIPILIKALREEQNLDEALDQVEPIEATLEDLEQISWIIGKKYEECKTYELEDFFVGKNVVPYFRVKSGGMEYGTESMGLTASMADS